MFYSHKDITSSKTCCAQLNGKVQSAQQKLQADSKSLLVQRESSSHHQQMMGDTRGLLSEEYCLCSSSKSVCRDPQLVSSSIGDIHKDDSLDVRMRMCSNALSEMISSKAKMTSNSGYEVMNSEMCKKKGKATATSVCDILYFQALLKTMDKLIDTECKLDKDEVVTLTLDEILQVLDNEKSTSKNEVFSNNVRHVKESKLKYKRKRSCDTSTLLKKTKLTKLKETSNVASVTSSTVYPSIMGDGGDLELLDKAEEGLLMREMERDAWKVCKSMRTYLECATQGIASCIIDQHSTTKCTLS